MNPLTLPQHVTYEWAIKESSMQCPDGNNELGNTHRIALALMKDMFTILRLIFCENLAATSATWNLNMHSREPGI